MEMQSVEDPTPGHGEVLVEVEYSGICGSELGGYLGRNSLRVPPLIMGHEFSGSIVALGPGVSRDTLSPGAHVTVNPLMPGGGRASAARANLSRTRQILGIHRPGSFAQYITVPAENTYRLPDGLSLEMAALTEPMACRDPRCPPCGRRPQRQRACHRPRSHRSSYRHRPPGVRPAPCDSHRSRCRPEGDR